MTTSASKERSDDVVDGASFIGAPATEQVDEAVDIRRLAQRLDRIVRNNETEAAATLEFVNVVRQLTGSLAVLYYGDDSTGQLAVEPSFRDPETIADHALNQLYALAARSQREGAVQVAQSGEEQKSVAMAVPVWRRDGQVEVLVALASGDTDDRRRLAGWVQILQFLSAFAGQWRGHFSNGDPEQPSYSQPGRLIQAMVDAGGASSFGEAVKVFANFLHEQNAGHYVAIGYRHRGGTCRLAALSDPYRFERGAPLVAWLETALAEAMIDPGDTANEFHVRDTEAIQELRSLSGAQHVYRLALFDGSTPSEQRPARKAIGACLLVSETAMSATDAQRWQETARVLGPQLNLLRQAQPTRVRAVRNWFRRQSKMRRRAMGLGAALAMIGVLTIPLPHRLKCSCEVQPVQRRYVASPYDGRLEKAFVEPGDLVKQGQILARMESREIETEILGVEASLSAAKAERQVAMSEGDTASSKIALAQMQVLNYKLRLFRERLKNLDVCSPTDGVVISGDPQKLEGSRLQMGQTLVEVGPLDRMFLELAVSDDDVAYAKPGSEVMFRLASTPFRRYRGTLTRLHPRAEQRDGKNVFVGEVEIENDGDLRPGMRGHAKLASGSRPLAWLLFHRAIEQILFRIGI